MSKRNSDRRYTSSSHHRRGRATPSMLRPTKKSHATGRKVWFVLAGFALAFLFLFVLGGQRWL